MIQAQHHRRHNDYAPWGGQGHACGSVLLAVAPGLWFMFLILTEPHSQAFWTCLFPGATGSSGPGRPQGLLADLVL